MRSSSSDPGIHGADGSLEVIAADVLVLGGIEAKDVINRSRESSASFFL